MKNQKYTPRLDRYIIIPSLPHMRNIKYVEKKKRKDLFHFIRSLKKFHLFLINHFTHLKLVTQRFQHLLLRCGVKIQYTGFQKVSVCV